MNLAISFSPTRIIEAGSSIRPRLNKKNHDENVADFFSLLRCINLGVAHNETAIILYKERAQYASDPAIKDDRHRMTSETFAKLKEVLKSHSPAKFTPQTVKKIAMKI